MTQALSWAQQEDLLEAHSKKARRVPALVAGFLLLVAVLFLIVRRDGNAGVDQAAMPAIPQAIVSPEPEGASSSISGTPTAERAAVVVPEVPVSTPDLDPVMMCLADFSSGRANRRTVASLRPMGPDAARYLLARLLSIEGVDRNSLGILRTLAELGPTGASIESELLEYAAAHEEDLVLLTDFLLQAILAQEDAPARDAGVQLVRDRLVRWEAMGDAESRHQLIRGLNRIGENHVSEGLSLLLELADPEHGGALPYGHEVAQMAFMALAEFDAHATAHALSESLVLQPDFANPAIARAIQAFPEGEVARALKPWVLTALAEERHPGRLSSVLDIAGFCGEDVVQPLIAISSFARESGGFVYAPWLKAIATATAASQHPDGIQVLKKELGQLVPVNDEYRGEMLTALFKALCATGDASAVEAVGSRLGTADAIEGSAILDALPPEYWLGHEMELLAFLDRMDGDSGNVRVAQLAATDRLVSVVQDKQEALSMLAAEPDLLLRYAERAHDVDSLEFLPAEERLQAIKELLHSAKGRARENLLEQVHDAVAEGISEQAVLQWLGDPSTPLAMGLAIATGHLDHVGDATILLGVLEERVADLIGAIENTDDARNLWIVLCAVAMSQPGERSTAVVAEAIDEWRGRGLGSTYADIEACIEDLAQRLGIR